jgi:SAM-dependent methyltransferase
MTNSHLNKFNFIAPFYDGLAKIAFGSHLKNAKNKYLQLINPEDKVLIIGGGTGDVLKSIIKNNPEQCVTYIEASSKMLAYAQNKIIPYNPGKVEFIHDNIISSEKYRNYNVIITNFFLDLFNDSELDSTGNVLYDCLSKEGIWIFTDFRSSKGNPVWQVPMISLMYLFFGLVAGLKTRKLANFNAFFNSKNLVKIDFCMFYGHMIESVVYRKE